MYIVSFAILLFIILGGEAFASSQCCSFLSCRLRARYLRYSFSRGWSDFCHIYSSMAISSSSCLYHRQQGHRVGNAGE